MRKVKCQMRRLFWFVSLLCEPSKAEVVTLKHRTVSQII